LGTVVFHESRGAAGREEASRNGVAEALPGITAAGAMTTACQRKTARDPRRFLPAE
jgi:hypothetical protein